MTIRKWLPLAAAALALSGLAAQAATVQPVSYDMRNGQTGSFNYWDDSYDGVGDNTIDGAFLSGGTGDLTDGVIATENWNVAETPRGPNGPYVGWVNIQPEITFNFAEVQDFTQATFYLDDSNGFGGVAPPSSITINGLTEIVADPSSGDPFAFVFDLTGLAPTDTLFVTMADGAGPWIFLSEVTFENSISAVPLPAGGLLLLTGLGAAGLMRRRKS